MQKKTSDKSVQKSLIELLKQDRVMALGVTLLCLIVLYFGFFLFLNVFYSAKIFPGIKVAGVSIGGKTKSEAEKTLGQSTSQIEKNGLKISIEEKSFTLDAKKIGLKYNLETSLDKAFKKNKMNLNLLNLRDRDVEIDYEVDQARVSEEIKGILVKSNIPAQDSKISFQNNQIVFSEEKSGQGVTNIELMAGAREAIGNLKTEFMLKTHTLDPRFTREILESKRSLLNDFFKESIKLTSEGKIYEVKKEEMAGWIETVKGETISLNKDVITKYIQGLALNINHEPVNAQLNIQDGKVTVFSLSSDGKKLMEEESIQRIIDRAAADRQIELAVETKKAEVNEGSMENLGLKELISVGYSDFTGSPQNRIYNIKAGLSRFNGVLIKPDELFSFNQTLGPVEASTGFLEELVILQNKTVPQFGGGLCQVSSTAFRAALNAGLPITARKNHAYPVKYYKPYGVDATIYLPNPDLKFKNDTGKYILIQTRIEGKKVYFEFYGTKKSENLKFAGNPEGTDASSIVEQVNPAITNEGGKGNGSFDATIYRLTYDLAGNLIKRDKFFSSYDSPDKYPH